MSARFDMLVVLHICSPCSNGIDVKNNIVYTSLLFNGDNRIVAQATGVISWTEYRVPFFWIWRDPSTLSVCPVWTPVI